MITTICLPNTILEERGLGVTEVFPPTHPVISDQSAHPSSNQYILITDH